MELPNKKTQTIFIIGALIVIGGLFLAYRSYEGGAPNPAGSDVGSTTADSLINEIIIDPNGSNFPVYSGRPVNELSADQKIVTQVSSSVFSAHKKSLVELAEKVKANPADVDSWFSAASLKKFYNDYAGASDIWAYVTKISPNNPIAYSNLGNLAMLVTKDFSLAESYFQMAISKDQSFAPAIFGLSELYWTFLPNRAADALKVLEQGLLVNPEEVSFMLNLGGYYRTLGNKEKSLEFFNRALSLHPADKNLQAAVTETEAYFK